MKIEYLKDNTDKNTYIVQDLGALIVNVCKPDNRDFGIHAVVENGIVTAKDIDALEQALAENYRLVRVLNFVGVSFTADAIARLSTLLGNQQIEGKDPSRISYVSHLHFLNTKGKIDVYELSLGVRQNKELRVLDFGNYALTPYDVAAITDVITYRKTHNTTPVDLELYTAYLKFNYGTPESLATLPAKASALCLGMLLSVYSNQENASKAFKSAMHVHAEPVIYCNNLELAVYNALTKWRRQRAIPVIPASAPEQLPAEAKAGQKAINKGAPLITSYKCHILAAVAAVSAAVVPAVVYLAAPRNIHS